MFLEEGCYPILELNTWASFDPSVALPKASKLKKTMEKFHGGLGPWLQEFLNIGFTFTVEEWAS